MTAIFKLTAIKDPAIYTGNMSYVVQFSVCVRTAGIHKSLGDNTKATINHRCFVDVEDELRVFQNVHPVPQ